MNPLEETRKSRAASELKIAVAALQTLYQTGAWETLEQYTKFLTMSAEKVGAKEQLLDNILEGTNFEGRGVS